MSLSRRLAPAALAVLLTAAVGASPAGAAPAPATPDQPTPVVVVLDASGSMKQSDAPGPRIDAAKRAVGDLVAALPAEARVGLLAYGTGTGSSAAEKAAGCRDIRRLVPVGPLDRPAFSRAVAGIRASGYTPIGESLRAAARELPTEGPRGIVLVSDGEDTCAPPPPCQVAAQLKAAGVDLVVHTVGFKVDAAARAQLTCIAAATGGTYREATSGAALGAELTRGVQRAIRPYSAVGTPIRGGADPAGAPTVTPGQYLDTYAVGGRGAAGDGTVKYYAVRLGRGDTPHISATIAPPPERAANIDVLAVNMRFVDAAGTTCGPTSDISAEVAVFGKVTPQSSTLEPPPVGEEPWTERCTAGPVYLRVARQGDAYRTQQLPVEIAFRLEPAASDPGPAAVTARSPGLPAPVAGPVRPAEAGYSYNDAPVLAPGTYAGSITTGETRYVRVRLGWGQRLSYRLGVPGQVGVGFQAAALYTRLASPLRAAAEQSSGGKSSALLGTDDHELSGSSGAPVRYRNRDSTIPGAQAYAVDGAYYLVLDLSYRLSREGPLTFPYTLTVATSGGESGPRYGTADPSGSASASATGSVLTGTAPDAGGGPPVWLLGIVAATAVAVAGGCVLWWRRRQPASQR